LHTISKKSDYQPLGTNGMRKIYDGDSYFPFLFGSEDGLGNPKVTDVNIIYVAKEQKEGWETWEDSKVIKIDLRHTVKDFIDCSLNNEHKIAEDSTEGAKQLIALLRELANQIEEKLGE